MFKACLSRVLLTCAAILAVDLHPANAGDLDPPAGPAIPTNRVTLNEQSIDLPCTIAEPGSYVLTSNLTGVAAQDGIVINADNVTLDLNGFALIGVDGSLDGISVPAAHTNLAVLNGTIRDWGRTGVNAETVDSGLFTDLRLAGNGINGLWCGKGSIVIRCTATGNGDDGFQHEGSGVIADCTADANLDAGITAGFGTTIVCCTTHMNEGQGIVRHVQDLGGVLTAATLTVSDCTADSNTQTGILAGVGSTITGCTARSNGPAGAPVHGIEAVNGATINDCTVEANGDSGIYVTFGSAVVGCTARNNTEDGICVAGIGSTGCRVAGNTCDSNGNGGDGAGIHVNLQSMGNRIESNNVTDNDRGIDVDSTGNIIIKNTASNNGGGAGNYDIAAGNSVGQVLDVSGVDITTSVAWRNFSY